MADIQVGEVDVQGGRYQVVLRRLGAAVGIAENNGNNVNAPEVANVAGVGPAAGGAKKGKKEKKAKGTRKLSGYMKFAQEIRPQLLKEDPSLRSDIPSIGRKIGEKWRALSDAEKARY